MNSIEQQQLALKKAKIELVYAENLLDEIEKWKYQAGNELQSAQNRVLMHQQTAMKFIKESML